MTKIVEERHPGESWLQWKFGNWLTIDQERIKSWALAWGFRDGGRWVLRPRRCDTGALFFNAVLFIRFSWPLGIYWAVRWSEKGKRAYCQAGFGFKLNGRFSITFRIQGDESAAAGVTGPNVGQAKGFDFGPH